MDERNDVSFGDFSKDETENIKRLSMQIQRDLSSNGERHFTDVLNEPLFRETRSTSNSDDQINDIGLDEELNNESSIDEDLSTNYDPIAANQSENNNSTKDKPKAATKPVEVYHSISHTDVSEPTSVVPETPKEQRSKQGSQLALCRAVCS